MAVTVTLVGTQDRSLEDRLRGVGMRVNTLEPADLAALAHPSAAPPDVVVLDLRSRGHIPPALALVKRQHPETGLILVAAALEPALMLDAMRAGVTECITEVDRDLEDAINRLVAQRSAPVVGEVFVLLGAKGGVGTTTVAVNTATVLSKVASTLVIDMHLAGGDAALFLGADPQFSVIDALENTHRLDASYFRGLTGRTKAGPDLLASTDRALAVAADAPRIRTLIDFAAHHYRYTVIDAPRSDSAVLDSLERATGIIVVANQELATVRSAGRVATILRQRYGKEKVSVVLSRTDRHAEIRLEDLQTAIGGPVRHSFPSDYRLAVQALNKGEPLVVEGKAPLAIAFDEFARNLAGVVDKPTATEKSGLFGRFSGRRLATADYNNR